VSGRPIRLRRCNANYCAAADVIYRSPVLAWDLEHCPQDGRSVSWGGQERDLFPRRAKVKSACGSALTTSGPYVLTHRAELRRGTTLALPLFAGSHAKGERGMNDGRDVRVLCRQGNSCGPRINCWCKQASRQEV